MLAMVDAAPEFKPKCVCLDIETSASDAFTLHKIAAFRPDSGQQLSLKGAFPARNLVQELDSLSAGAAFSLGHNIVRHDLPVLRQLYPQLRLHALPVVDTLELSPLAFPENPYHSLVKDYKLVRASRNDPLKDAQLTLRLLHDQFNAFKALQESAPEALACFHFLLTRHPDAGVDSFFVTVRRAPQPKAAEVRAGFIRLTHGKVCATHVGEVFDAALADPALCAPMAYVLAWLRVSGGNSVLPPWVSLQFPAVRAMVRELRETACDDPACAYCTQYLNPRRELERYFGFAAFRPEPPNQQGGSLQEDIVRAGYAGQSILAILPTGGGKSICYQLPALSRHWRNGSLTVVVSPLQSLMKDQVDNLVGKGIYSGATLNGMLSMPERHDVLERVRLGDVGILLVSPEQFRNKAFVEAIRYREIGAWVFDEAHCLSRWGNDFRPDYVYVSRFIREKYCDRPAPVSCFTATAKREVVEDLQLHFRESLGVELAVIDGGHERHNLHYELMQATKAEKHGLIGRLLEQELRQTEGGAVIFTSRRKSAEETAGFLKDMGWACAHFHAGMDAGIKKEVQQSFLDGSLRVIVATNAFGMGVDKSDVRLVIHAEIPGSLENYLQEAGRAGRDSKDARCILLYDEEDVEAQFAMTTRSQLSRRDIAGILRALRRHSAKTRSTEVVVTSGEILADDEVETAIEAENPDADTKVRTAVAWLEKSRFLQRDENHTRVFPGSLKVGSLEEAAQRLNRADLSDEMRRKFLELVSLLINAREDEGISTDELMMQLGLPSQECIKMLQQLDRLGILSNDVALTVLLRKGVKDSSDERFRRLAKLESALVDLLPELAPDADGGEWQEMNLRGVCQEIKTRTEVEFLPEQLLTLMRSLARPFGDEGNGRRSLFEVRLLRREILHVHLQRNWPNIREIAARRRVAAAVLLNALLAKIDAHLQGVDLRVECKIGELAEALRTDIEFGPSLRDDLAAIEAGLLYLHDNGVLIIDRGKSVFRSAMTIQIYPEGKGRKFTVADFEPLKEHYDEKKFQVHVIQEYARLGLQKISDALPFVMAYFTLPKLEFIRRYFAGRREMLERATTEESYRRIVEALKHPLQQTLVAEKPDANRLILAGPGSGKTRVIVHRVAYLLRVLREPASGMLVLAFNRSAAWEIRHRLYELIGLDAAGVTVLTYHALAMRLTGVSPANLAEHGQEFDFDRILDDALALLAGKMDIPGGDDGEALRERLLAGYRYIFVDEYQDIDARQYALISALISALAGRQIKDGDAKLTVLAVGDDDQNIYAFRATSNEFIRRFQADYQAQTEFLVENYRSSRNIIETSNALIAANAKRMKREHPIRIDHVRTGAPPGGRWEKLDALGRGRVLILTVPDDAIGQAAVTMAEVCRLKTLDATSDWSDFMVLARNRATLEPIRAWCEMAGVRYTSPDHEQSGQPKLHQTKEGQALLAQLQAKPRRRVSQGALARWFRLRFGDGNPDNSWQGLLSQFIDEQKTAWPESAIPSSILVDAFYEFGNEARRSELGRIVLSTVHGAKGRECRNVLILDGGDWQKRNDEERRLYYVGMTRAKENLLLCRGSGKPNPFIPALEAMQSVCHCPLPNRIERLPALGLRFAALGMGDVDLSYAGRYPGNSPVHQALQALNHGDALQLMISGKGRELQTAAGLCVGRLSKKYQLPQGRIVKVPVNAVIRRTRKQSTEIYRDALKVDAWWVVLPMIVIEPEESI